MGMAEIPALDVALQQFNRTSTSMMRGGGNSNCIGLAGYFQRVGSQNILGIQDMPGLMDCKMPGFWSLFLGRAQLTPVEKVFANIREAFNGSRTMIASAIMGTSDIAAPQSWAARVSGGGGGGGPDGPSIG